MPNDEMSREEAERWLAELTANPERMSAKMFQEGYEASLRKSGLLEAEISPLLRKARRADYAKTIMGGRFIIERANKASRALPGSL